MQVTNNIVERRCQVASLQFIDGTTYTPFTLRVDFGARKINTNSVGWAINGVGRGHMINAQFDWKGDRKESAPRYRFKSHQIWKGVRLIAENKFVRAKGDLVQRGWAVWKEPCGCAIETRLHGDTADLQSPHLVSLQFLIPWFQFVSVDISESNVCFWGRVVPTRL